MDAVYNVLKSNFGYDKFRTYQEEIIKKVLEKKDVVVIMPTGSGKSLCYQIPALMFSGLTIVVSPLISLMKDQVLQLKENGIAAIFLNSSLSFEEYNDHINSLLDRKVKLLYVAPETLVQQRTINILRQLQIDLIAVDEAHCISEWGHDFRPEYRRVIDFRKHFPTVKTIALTATATAKVLDDIKNNLQIYDAETFVSSFDRQNLILEVIPKINAFYQTIEFVKRFENQSGLIYCFSRKQVDDLAFDLQNLGYSALPYHAGLSAADRAKNQEAFINDDVRIIVATIAFGMGINKPDVRFVLHHDLPKNIESYYQQIGRAGRDGLDAHCRLLFSYSDTAKIKYFIKEKEDKERMIALNQLNALVNYCESETCRRIPLLHYFGENYEFDNCEKCDICLKEDIPKQDITVETQKFLSCIKRTNESFGVSHIIDILRGSKNKKILNRNHDKISTYGIGMDLSRKQWYHLYRQFIRKDIIDLAEYNVLKLNKNSWDILKGEKNLSGTLIEGKSTYVVNEPINYDTELFEMLRLARKSISIDKHIPPYAVFSDKTLIDISTYYPQSKESLLKMHGLGEQKTRKYGSILLEIIIGYCADKEISDLSHKIIRITKIPKSTSRRYHEVGKMFNSGLSLDEITEQLSVKTDTVIKHLFKFKREGNALMHKIEINLPEQEIISIEDAFSELGTDLLKPIYQRFEEKYSYEILRKILLNYL